METKSEMGQQRRQIIEKWYQALSFDSIYDEKFYLHLSNTDVSDITDFPSYDYKNNTPQKNLLACLYFCEALEEEYQKRDISRTILIDSLQDVVLWNQSYYNVHGDVGLTEFPWIDRTFLLQIFRLGRLQFSMFPSEFDIPELGIKVNDPVLEVHIPRGGPLKYEDCKASMQAAPGFFEKYFPDFPRQWCICHSWLLDTTILPLLGENSNIEKFQTFFRPVQRNVSDSVIRFSFLWNTTRENIKDCDPTSGFTKRLKEQVLTGREFYEVLGIHKFQ